MKIIKYIYHYITWCLDVDYTKHQCTFLRTKEGVWVEDNGKILGEYCQKAKFHWGKHITFKEDKWDGLLRVKNIERIS